MKEDEENGIRYYDIPLGKKALVGCWEWFHEKNIRPPSIACYRQFFSWQPDKPSMDQHSLIKNQLA